MRKSNTSKLAVGEAWFRAASDQSLLVSFGQQITLENHRTVLKLLRLLQSKPIHEIRNLHPAYCSLLIKFDPLRLDHDELQTRLAPYLARLQREPLAKPQHVVIPVCYCVDFGLDYNDMASMLVC